MHPSKRPLTPEESLLTRRKALQIGGLGVAGLALFGAAGCGGGSSSTSSGNTSSGGGGSKDVTFGYFKDETAEALVDKFNATNGEGINVTFREMPANVDEAYTQIRTQFQAGSSSFDVIGGPTTWPAELAANGWIADVTDRPGAGENGRFVTPAYNACSLDGRMYALPLYWDAGLLFYRRDLLEEAGFKGQPESYDELKEMATAVTGAGKAKHGFVFQGADYEGGVINTYEYIWNFGGDVVDPSDPKQATLDTPEVRSALEMQRSMIEDGVSPASVLNFTEEESGTAFLRGESVFLRNWPYVYSLLGDPSQSKISTSQVGVGTLPAGAPGVTPTSCGSGYLLYLSAESKSQDAAWKFIQYLTSAASQKPLAVAGFTPVLNELFEDKALLKKNPVLEFAHTAVEQSTPSIANALPTYADASKAMETQFHASLAGETSPEDAGSTANSELATILDKTTKVYTSP